MKNTLNFIAIILILLSPFVSIAQQQQALEITPTDQPYPARNQATSEKATAFISVFDDTNVGNLHVYAPAIGEENEEYFYYGTDITGSFTDMLPRKLRRTLLRTDGKLFATKNIRGVGGEYYIIRTSDKQGNPVLDIYELAGTKLAKVMMLANRKCKEAGCRQMDSWIQDVNGDTRLDIIQKRKKGKSEKLKVFTQNVQGKFMLDNDVQLNPTDYQLESIK
ncbi:MAG: hypothetical protein AB8G22_24485 [Saprospiraceae bacterium]